MEPRKTPKRKHCKWCDTWLNKDYEPTDKKFCNKNCKARYHAAKHRVELHSDPELFMKSRLNSCTMREYLMLETIRKLRQEIQTLKDKTGDKND